MGIGKSTVCAALNRRLHHSVWLDGDWCWMMHPWVYSEENRQMVVQNITYLLRSFLLNSTFDYVLFSWVLHRQEIADLLLSHLQDLDFSMCALTLLCSEPALRARLAEDGRSAEEIERSVARLPLYRQVNSVKVDTTGHTAEETVEQLWTIVAGDSRGDPHA
jgi:broad-specificity NMP kinase